MAQAQPAQQLHQPAPRSAFYPPYTQAQGQDQLLDPALDLANDLRLVYQHNSYQDRLARATRHVYDQVRTHQVSDDDDLGVGCRVTVALQRTRRGKSIGFNPIPWLIKSRVFCQVNKTDREYRALSLSCTPVQR